MVGLVKRVLALWQLNTRGKWKNRAWKVTFLCLLDNLETMMRLRYSAMENKYGVNLMDMLTSLVPGEDVKSY